MRRHISDCNRTAQIETPAREAHSIRRGRDIPLQKDTDVRCSIVFVVAAWLAVCAAVTGGGQHEPESTDSGPAETRAAYPAPLTPSIAAALVAQAPAIGKTSFGPGVVVSIVRPAILFSEARVVDE